MCDSINYRSVRYTYTYTMIMHLKIKNEQIKQIQNVNKLHGYRFKLLLIIISQRYCFRKILTVKRLTMNMFKYFNDLSESFRDELQQTLAI